MAETPTIEEVAENSGSVLSDWMTRQELASELGLAVDTLAKWATAGTGPVFIRIGSRAYYRRATVKEWLVTLEGQQNSRRHR